MTDVNEITKETLEHILAGMRNQDKMERSKTSETLPKLKEWVEDKQKDDPFITPVDKKLNPWNEKGGKCIVS